MIKLTKKVIATALKEFFETVLICTVVFFIVYVFIGQVMVVTGNSMYPTYKNNQKIIVEKLSVKYRPIKRGEVIIFKEPVENILVIKRVVGMPGDKIKVADGKVYVNDQAPEESYLQPNIQTTAGTAIQDGVDYKIPSDAYMLLGDNRKDSIDSRVWGFLTKQDITGRVFVAF